MADRDEDQLDSSFQGHGDARFRGTVDYRTVLTSQLIAAFAKAQRATLDEDCHGRYIKGDECGMDSSPITCGQDVPNAHLYQTDAGNGAGVTITYSAVPSGKAASCRLLNQAGRWKIDGVRRVGGQAFNLK